MFGELKLPFLARRQPLGIPEGLSAIIRSRTKCIERFSVAVVVLASMNPEGIPQVAQNSSSSGIAACISLDSHAYEIRIFRYDQRRHSRYGRGQQIMDWVISLGQQ